MGSIHLHPQILFQIFFPDLPKTKKKEIQNESYRGHCLQRKKKGSSDITKKKQNRLFAKKKKISPIDLKKQKLRGSQFKSPHRSFAEVYFNYQMYQISRMSKTMN